MFGLSRESKETVRKGWFVGRLGITGNFRRNRKREAKYLLLSKLTSGSGRDPKQSFGTCFLSCLETVASRLTACTGVDSLFPMSAVRIHWNDCGGNRGLASAAWLLLAYHLICLYPIDSVGVIRLSKRLSHACVFNVSETANGSLEQIYFIPVIHYG